MYQKTKATYLFTMALSLALSISCNKASALDVNLNGTANLNFNPINNNKYSNTLQNYSPGMTPWAQVDLSPLGTPPPTSVIKRFDGNKIWAEEVDKDFDTPKEFRESRRNQGLSVSKPPETPDDDQEVKDSDIQNFLGNYYKYLHKEGLSSSSLPVIKEDTPAAKSKASKVKTTSHNNAPPKELKATEQKLLSSNSGTPKSSPHSP